VSLEEPETEFLMVTVAMTGVGADGVSSACRNKRNEEKLCKKILCSYYKKMADFSSG
jgi:hypothetical protein